MNKEWSEKNREIQKLLNRRDTYKEGIDKLIMIRQELFEQITQNVNTYPEAAFYAMPFPKANGYHSKTLAYSIWHIFRIEDIVAHEMIAGDEQIFFFGNWQEKIGSAVITTGNELSGREIADFSRQLDVKNLYQYAKSVMVSTDDILKDLSYSDLKQNFTDDVRKKLLETGCVSAHENAAWLIDYWCNKNVCGLLKMPFSRHWIMHIEAMQRIKNQLCHLARKGVDPVAYCGFSCNHCFLAQWCGSCRTDYNVCSYAACSEDGKCPNAACCQEKNIDGCYECLELETCQKGFYTPENDGANAAKAQAMYIRKYGKKEFLKMQDQFHEKYHFSKTQEILGQDMCEGLKILESIK